jgi:hypothetical protein
MKRILSVALALTLLSGSAAVAGPYGHGNYGQRNGYSEQYRGDHYRGGHYRGHRGNDGGAIAFGIGILALTAIIASQNRDREIARERAMNRNYDQGGYDQGAYGPNDGPNGYGPNAYGPNDGPNGYGPNGYDDQNRR